jgi:hypothetical protein
VRESWKDSHREEKVRERERERRRNGRATGFLLQTERIERESELSGCYMMQPNRCREERTSRE